MERILHSPERSSSSHSSLIQTLSNQLLHYGNAGNETVLRHANKLEALLKQLPTAEAEIDAKKIIHQLLAEMIDDTEGAFSTLLRPYLWMYLLDVETNSNDLGLKAFLSNPRLDEPNQTVIHADSLRTRASIIRFKTPWVIQLLECLLTYYCRSNKLSYKQGMNELMAPFLCLQSKGYEAQQMYRCYSNFISRFMPFMFTDEKFMYLQSLFCFLKQLLRYHDPQLFLLLSRNSITPELYATPWILTLFASTLSLKLLLSLWDYYLCEGDAFFVLFISVSLLISNRVELFETETSSLLERVAQLKIDSHESLKAIWRLSKALKTQTPRSFYQTILPYSSDTIGMNTLDELESIRCIEINPRELLRHAIDTEVSGDSKWRLMVLDLRLSNESTGCRLPLSINLIINKHVRGRLEELIRLILSSSDEEVMSMLRDTTAFEGKETMGVTRQDDSRTSVRVEAANRGGYMMEQMFDYISSMYSIDESMEGDGRDEGRRKTIQEGYSLNELDSIKRVGGSVVNDRFRNQMGVVNNEIKESTCVKFDINDVEEEDNLMEGIKLDDVGVKEQSTKRYHFCIVLPMKERLSALQLESVLVSRGIRYVSIARGGYEAIHQEAMKRRIILRNQSMDTCTLCRANNVVESQPSLSGLVSSLYRSVNSNKMKGAFKRIADTVTDTINVYLDGEMGGVGNSEDAEGKAVTTSRSSLLSDMKIQTETNANLIDKQILSKEASKSWLSSRSIATISYDAYMKMYASNNAYQFICTLHQLKHPVSITDTTTIDSSPHQPPLYIPISSITENEALSKCYSKYLFYGDKNLLALQTADVYLPDCLLLITPHYILVSSQPVEETIGTHIVTRGWCVGGDADHRLKEDEQQLTNCNTSNVIKVYAVMSIFHREMYKFDECNDKLLHLFLKHKRTNSMGSAFRWISIELLSREDVIACAQRINECTKLHSFE